MAQFSVTTGVVALSATSTKSLWLLNPVTNQFVITQIDVSLDANAVANGLKIDLYRVNALGTPAGSAGVENALNPTTQAATTTSLTTLTTEPTSVFVLDSWYVQPLGGLLVLQYPLGREPLGAQAGSRIGLRYTTTSGSGAPNCLATVWFDE